MTRLCEGGGTQKIIYCPHPCWLGFMFGKLLYIRVRVRITPSCRRGAGSSLWYLAVQTRPTMRYPCFALGCVYLQAHSPLLVRHLPQWATLPSRFHQQNQPCRQVQHWKQPALRPSMGSSMTRRATKRSRAFLSNEAVSYYHHLDSGSEICLVGVIHDARASSRVRKSRLPVALID